MFKTFLLPKILLILILILRVSLFYIPPFHIDMNGWIAWSLRLMQVGPSNFYSPNFFADYFPGYLYILWVAGSIFNFFSLPINSFSFEFFLKSITTIFDIASAFYIYKIVLKYNKQAIFAPILYLINPAVIFNSSVWGQTDGIFTFFLILSSYLLIEKRKIFSASFTMALGIIIKPHSLALLPLFLISSLINFTKPKIVKSFVLGVLTLILLSLPFFLKNPIFGIFDLAFKSQDVYKFTSLFAFNFWGLMGSWKPDNALFILSYKTWGIILYTISMLLIIVPLVRRKIDPKQFYLAASLSLFSFFLFPTRIHERYLLPFLAFILIAAAVKKSKSLFVIYIVTSIIHFINLWFVYYYYNFVYNNSKFSNNFFYILVNNNYKFFSLILLGSFFIILFKYYKSIYVKKS